MIDRTIFSIACLRTCPQSIRGDKSNFCGCVLNYLIGEDGQSDDDEAEPPLDVGEAGHVDVRVEESHQQRVDGPEGAWGQTGEETVQQVQHPFVVKMNFPLGQQRDHGFHQGS